MLYDLLAKSLIRIIYPKAVLDDTTVLIDVNQVKFKASGTVVVSPGWYAVDGRKMQNSRFRQCKRTMYYRVNIP